MPANDRPKRMRPLERLFSGLLLLHGAMFGAGCHTVAYYHQAMAGHADLLSRQKPIPPLLADLATPPALKAQLELVLRLRQFAESELALPCNGHYLKYVALERPYVLWNVHAAPETSLHTTARRWRI